MQEYVFSDEELAEIERVSLDKFSSWEWIYGHSPQFYITLTTRFTAGKIQVFATVKNSVIENIKFYGTFFGNNGDLSPVENALKGVEVYGLRTCTVLLKALIQLSSLPVSPWRS
jgi:lipoate-protein ligase A